MEKKLLDLIAEISRQGPNEAPIRLMFADEARERSASPIPGAAGARSPSVPSAKQW